VVNAVDIKPILTEVAKKPKYAGISAEIIQRIAAMEFQKRKTLKEALKGTLAKLHQLGGAYLEQRPDFAQWSREIAELPEDLRAAGTKNFCLEKMRGHASTSERLPIINEFYQTCLQSIAPIQSILDLGCGIHPLALPWMPLAEDPMYLGMDIFKEMTDFDQRFLQQVRLRGRVLHADFLGNLPRQRYQLALCLKIIPLIDQVNQGITRTWLEKIPAEHILVSFPTSSLGGRSKGMPAHYRERFAQLTSESHWRVETYEFPSELAFLLQR
jgi:16S rRNA (guanine(1405)-N(7))-methyltransferase